MSRYKAAIFDLDGTLLDTLADLRDSMNHTMELFGFPTHSTEAIRSFVGSGVEQFVASAVPGGFDNPHFREIVKEYSEYYGIHSEDQTKPYDGVLDLITKLKDSGIAVAVVSNKAHSASRGLCRTHFPEVEIVNGEREAEGVRRKPYPDMVLMTVKEIGVKPEECVYIGDSEVDILTAENAGMDCISVLWGFRDRDYLEENGGKVFVENTDELFSAITD